MRVEPEYGDSPPTKPRYIPKHPHTFREDSCICQVCGITRVAIEDYQAMAECTPVQPTQVRAPEAVE